MNGIEDTTTYYSGGTFESRDEFQNSFAAHASVDGIPDGAFSGELDLAFSREVRTSSSFVLSYRSMFAQLAYLQLRPDPQYLSSEFSERLNLLPLSFTPDVLNVFEDFFNSFGVYFTSKVVIGANLDFWVATEKSSSITDVEISSYLSAEYGGVLTTGSISADITASARLETVRGDLRRQHPGGWRGPHSRGPGRGPAAVAAQRGQRRRLPGLDRLDQDLSRTRRFPADRHLGDRADASKSIRRRGTPMGPACGRSWSRRHRRRCTRLRRPCHPR